ncbi:MAG TPA: 1-(5-phosphoribosyl)-5-[(5-phosphoribosylamino)methylideneamino] imidazole-4-carboxamide isomerase [Candidatus Dormibacteraeota bacterium]
MQVIPALDLRGGRVVRLRQGDFDTERAYGDDPAAAAAAFAAAGATHLHVVDLDAARGGAHNRGAVAAILDRTPVAVQVAGGIRGAPEVDRWLEAGAAAVVIGTTAVRQPDVLHGLAAERPGRLLAALDLKAGRPAVTGWSGVEELDLEELLDAWNQAALGGVILTSVDRDGTLEGPDLDALRRVRALARHPLTYSGGIAELADLEAVRAAGADAVIVGRSLLEGRFRLEEALACAG